jgi:hypothetical protein
MEDLLEPNKTSGQMHNQWALIDRYHPKLASYSPVT